MREVIFKNGKAYGVRDKNGFICFMRDVFHYTGQDGRYKDELAEIEADAHLIAVAPDLLAACKLAVVVISEQHKALTAITKGIAEKAGQTPPDIPAPTECINLINEAIAKGEI